MKSKDNENKLNLEENNITEKTHYVYILRCSDDSLYTGWTTNLEKRIYTHNSGKGAKYTRSRLPVKLVYHENFLIKVVHCLEKWRLNPLVKSKRSFF